MRKILLNKNKGKQSVNNTNSIPFELNRDVSLLHNELNMDTFDTMELYNNERDNSTKHRMIFTIHPLCSNILFNNITEIVYKEGSDDATVLDNTTKNNLRNNSINTGDLNRKHAIRNTEYSNDVFNLTYHCGSDIFNNHLLRMNDNTIVLKRDNGSAMYSTIYTDETSTYKIDAFNTIGDYSRSFSGKDILVNMPSSGSSYVYDKEIKVPLPLYIIDNIKSFKDSFNEGIKKENGWFGVNNNTTMRISLNDNDDYSINKCFNNKQPCQFVDMTPERDLFYFTPKKNLYKNRLENNWDVFITYPYKSIYNDGTLLNGRGLPLIGFTENKLFHEYINDSGLEIALFRTPVRHNLKIGDTIKLIFPTNSESSGSTVLCSIVKLGTSEGKYKDYYFSIRKSDFENYLKPSNNPINPCRFVRMSHGFECEYYFRKFKKIKKNGEDLKNTINKVAFSETIYGDEISQIIFTDDVNLEGLIDNRCRPLSEVFLTIVKTNRGYKGWYENGKYSDYIDKNKLCTVEYSHVFGSITSGLDLPNYAGKDYPTIRYQHNINNGSYLKKNNVTITEISSIKLENDITKECEDFFGDLVEYDPIYCNEITLENVYHRFNTAQREYYNQNGSFYDTLFYDEIYGDIYDGGYYGAKHNGQTRIKENKMNEGFANLSPEGYIYNPHYKIKVAELSNSTSQNSDIFIDIKNHRFIPNGINDLVFFTDKNYSLGYGDIITFINNENKKYYCYKIMSYKLNDSGNNINDGNFIGEAIFYESPYEAPSENDKNSVNKKWFIHNTAIPNHASLLPDGSGTHLWRSVKKFSDMNNNDEMYNIPFTNGAFYHHKNIMFSVKRQDPFGHYGMYIAKNGIKLENNFEMPSNEFDSSEYEHIDLNTNQSSCF